MASCKQVFRSFLISNILFENLQKIIQERSCSELNNADVSNNGNTSPPGCYFGNNLMRNYKYYQQIGALLTYLLTYLVRTKRK